MKYFIDTEFVFDADNCTVIPISLALVGEDGWAGYWVTQMFSPRYCPDFVRDHVIPVLWEFGDSDPDWCPMPLATERIQIPREIRSFIGRSGEVPEFWGDYSAFDYVVLSVLMDGFDHWPEGWPMHVNDLQQIGLTAGPSEVPHNALCDARAVRDVFISSPVTTS